MYQLLKIKIKSHFLKFEFIYLFFVYLRFIKIFLLNET